MSPLEVSSRFTPAGLPVIPEVAAEAAAPTKRGQWPLSVMRREHFAKGQYLFRAGDKADKLFYISKGSIRLPELNVVVQPGQVLGEMGIFSPARARTASALCEEDLEAFTMGREEVVQLFTLNPSLALDLMQLVNKRFIENLRVETEAKERIRSELRVAREIQASMLPRTFPAFPERNEFELFATMDPAEEVGGDFYDFFFITPRKLCLVVGDVSGKGVPGALFMAISKALLKSEAMRNYPLHKVMERVNDLLCQDNPLCIFVTVFAAILDTQSGQLEVCNAGHNAPLVSRKGGAVEWLTAPQGRVLGFMPKTQYCSGKHQLSSGELLLLYTDGVTEAMNAQHQLFAEDRLKASLVSLCERPLTELVTGIRRELAEHAQSHPQSDDITLLALRFTGKVDEKPKVAPRHTRAMPRPRR